MTRETFACAHSTLTRRTVCSRFHQSTCGEEKAEYDFDFGVVLRQLQSRRNDSAACVAFGTSRLLTISFSASWPVVPMVLRRYDTDATDERCWCLVDRKDNGHCWRCVLFRRFTGDEERTQRRGHFVDEAGKEMTQADAFQDTAGLFEYADSHGNRREDNCNQYSAKLDSDGNQFRLQSFGLSALRADPDVAAARASEKQVRGPGPPKCRYHYAIVGVAMRAGFGNASFGFLVKPRTVRMEETSEKYSCPNYSEKLSGRKQYSKLRKESSDKAYKCLRSTTAAERQIGVARLDLQRKRQTDRSCKGHGVRPVAAKQEMVESTAAVRSEADNFSIKHCIHAADGMRKFGAEKRPGFENVAAARNQSALVASM